MVSPVTQILERAASGDADAPERLLPLVYEELRRQAAAKLRRERAGQTLAPTELVHEAYLRLVGDESARWEHAGHFYAAAAEAMRRILIERARRKKRVRHGGQHRRVQFEEAMNLSLCSDPALVLAVNDAMARLQPLDSRMHELVKLRCYLGMTIAEAAKVLGVTPRTLNRDWLVAKAWLTKELAEPGEAIDEPTCRN